MTQLCGLPCHLVFIDKNIRNQLPHYAVLPRCVSLPLNSDPAVRFTMPVIFVIMPVWFLSIKTRWQGKHCCDDRSVQDWVAAAGSQSCLSATIDKTTRDLNKSTQNDAVKRVRFARTSLTNTFNGTFCNGTRFKPTRTKRHSETTMLYAMLIVRFQQRSQLLSKR